MPYVLDEMPLGAHAAIIRLRSLGDCVLTTPAIRILKQARADLEIAVVVEDRFAAVFEENPDVSRILPPRVGSLREWNPRLALNLHGGTRSIALTAASGAAVRAGFAHHKGASVYHVRIPRAQEILGEERVVHTAEHLASAMFYLGAPVAPIPRASLHAPRWPSDVPYAVIHAVAATVEKTWPADRFLAVSAHLQAQGLEPVFVGGGADDLSPFEAYRSVRGAPLKDAMSLIQGAALFVGNDSGPAHIAAAFGIPVVVLFGPSDPAIWRPWRTEAEVLASSEGIERIGVAQVIHAIDQLRVAQ